MLVESPDTSYSGLGANTVKLTLHGSTICLIGGDENQVFFPRPVSIEEVLAVADVLNKKRLRTRQKEEYEKSLARK